MNATQELLRFGAFELNLDTEELRKSGALIKLSPQPFQLLALLASHAGQVVTREAIQKQLWGEDSEVDFEHGMRQCINQIRTALGDNPENPLYIETLPRHGYRFIAPATSKTVAAPPPLVKESTSSGIEGAIVSRVLARIAAATAAAPPRTPVIVQPEREILPSPVARVGGTAIQSAAARHWKLLAGLLVVAVALVVGITYWHSRRTVVDFGAEKWFVDGGNPDSYEAGIDSHAMHNGHASARLRSKERAVKGFGTLTQFLPTDKYRGKRVRFSGFARSQEVEDWTGLWMRVDKGRDRVAFDNMQERPIRGTTSWQQYEVVLDVPQDATGIFFGVLLAGPGTVWLNGVNFEVVGPDVPTTGKSSGPDEP